MPSSTHSPDVDNTTSQFDSIEDTISAFRNGSFIIVLDDPSRENEGDLIIAAQDVTTEKMAFMIRYTSGLICLPTTSPRCDALRLPPMVPQAASEDPKRTAYTLSIDAASPLTTTGISAHDRALTCRTLAAPAAVATDLRRPGHVIPLRAKGGGVRERAGHTEAAVEFCRLAGKESVAAIAELVLDGEEVVGEAWRREPGMMRRDECLAFGRQWGLKVCTIEALIKYVEAREEKLLVNGNSGSA